MSYLIFSIVSQNKNIISICFYLFIDLILQKTRSTEIPSDAALLTAAETIAQGIADLTQYHYHTDDNRIGTERADGALDIVADGVLDNVADGALDNVADGALDNVADVALGNVADGALDNVAEGALDTVTDDALDNVTPDSVNKVVCYDTSHSVPIVSGINDAAKVHAREKDEHAIATSDKDETHVNDNINCEVLHYLSLYKELYDDNQITQGELCISYLTH